MTSQLVTPQTLAQFSRADVSGLADPYLSGVCLLAHRLVRTYLGYDPAIQTHVHEQGAVQLLMSGRERAMAALRVQHQPLVSTVASDVFTEIQLIYPSPMPALDILAETTVLGGISLWQGSGMVRIPFLGYGVANAIWYQYGATSYWPYAGPTGYQATYLAGYAMTSAEQTAYPAAPLIPPELQQAAAWLVEAVLAQGQRVSDDLGSALAGELQSFQNLDYSEHYQRDQRGDANSVGRGLSVLFGTQQGRWAQEVMDLYRRTSIERVLFA